MLNGLNDNIFWAIVLILFCFIPNRLKIRMDEWRKQYWEIFLRTNVLVYNFGWVSRRDALHKWGRTILLLMRPKYLTLCVCEYVCICMWYIVINRIYFKFFRFGQSWSKSKADGFQSVLNNWRKKSRGRGSLSCQLLVGWCVCVFGQNIKIENIKTYSFILLVFYVFFSVHSCTPTHAFGDMDAADLWISCILCMSVCLCVCLCLFESCINANIILSVCCAFFCLRLY